jgi:dipeptidyl aminopeptidase/acylaminoacyl peptidase
MLNAWLLLPEGTKQDGSLPVIVEVYPMYPTTGLEPDPTQFDGGPRRTWDPLRKAGYALLVVNTPEVYNGSVTREALRGHVCDDIAVNTLSALDAAIETGWIDGRKAGVVGFSGGGYAVNCLVTRTDRFRAAISASGFSEFASVRSSMEGGTLSATFMGAAPWEAPEHYAAESPLYRLDRVTTPLFGVVGKHEITLADQMRQMYFGLKLLNRPALFVSYDDSDHGQFFEMPDFWARALSWLDDHVRDQGITTRPSSQH